MKIVKLHPNCHTRHRPPHIPWYINEDCTGLATDLDKIEWLVTELPENKNVFQINGFYIGKKFFQYKKGYQIQKKDCVGYNKLL